MPMNLSALLGKKLKDDDILEVLEDYQIDEVVYDFDRSHENIEDAYWAPAREAGFQLRFNQDQVLDVIFCYVAALEGFTPVDLEITGVSIFETFDDAELACKRNALRYSISDSTKGEEFRKKWLRIEEVDYWTHYQFENGSLIRLTLMLPKS
jgi:hypothetical protein